MARIAANIAIASNNTPASVGLVSPIAANQTQHLTYWIPFSLGATGGLKAQVSVPAGGTAFIATFYLRDTVTPGTITAEQTASAVFSNALAVAGNHWLEIKVTVVNGATPGNVDLLMSQNTVDVLTLTILQGGTVEVQKFN